MSCSERDTWSDDGARADEARTVDEGRFGEAPGGLPVDDRLLDTLAEYFVVRLFVAHAAQPERRGDDARCDDGEDGAGLGVHGTLPFALPEGRQKTSPFAHLPPRCTSPRASRDGLSARLATPIARRRQSCARTRVAE